MNMNKKKIILCILSFLIITTATHAANAIADFADEIYGDEKFFHGIIVSSNFINGFSIGIGYNLSTVIYKEDIPIFAWVNMGLLFEYKLNNTYRMRNYYHIDIFDMLSLGFSGIVSYYKDFSIGISPEIGIQLPLIFPLAIGHAGLFYRYNFFNKSEHNNHEFGLNLVFYDLKLFKRLSKK